MRRRRSKATWTAAALAMTLALAATAWAAPRDRVLTGSTTEGVKVKLAVDASGEATELKIGRALAKCDEGGTLSTNAGTYMDFDSSSPGAFSDRSRSESDNAGYHFKTRLRVEGAVERGRSSWSGVFKFVSRVYQHDARVDTCKLNTEWHAS